MNENEKIKKDNKPMGMGQGGPAGGLSKMEKNQKSLRKQAENCLDILNLIECNLLRLLFLQF